MSWPLAVAGVAAETEVLLNGLRGPVSLSTQPSPGRGVLVAEADGRAIQFWRPDAEGSIELVDEPPARLSAAAYRPTCVRFLDAKTFLVAWCGGADEPIQLAFYSLKDDQSAELKTSRKLKVDTEESDSEQVENDALTGVVASLALGEKYLYATVVGQESRVVRARHNSGLLSVFHPVAELKQGAAFCCETPRGYVLTAQGSRLTYSDGARPGGAPLAEFVTPIDALTAISYGRKRRPAEKLLYVSSANPGREGIYRVDAAVQADGRPSVANTPVAELAGVRAMAFAGNGELLVVTQTPSGEGQLLRVLAEL